MLELRLAAISMDASRNSRSYWCGTLWDGASLTVPAVLAFAARVQVVVRHARAMETSLGTEQLGAIAGLPAVCARAITVSLLFRGTSAMTGACGGTRRAGGNHARTYRAVGTPVKHLAVLAVGAHVETLRARALASAAESAGPVACTMSTTNLVFLVHARARLAGGTKVGLQTRGALLATACFGHKARIACTFSCAGECSSTITFSVTRACLAAADDGGTLSAIRTEIDRLACGTKLRRIKAVRITLAGVRGARSNWEWCACAVAVAVVRALWSTDALLEIG
jgi:hypothetical protein